MFLIFKPIGGHFHPCNRKGNSVSSKTQYKITVFKIFVFANIRQSVFGFAKSSCPDKISRKEEVWQVFFKGFQKFLFFFIKKSISFLGVMKRFIFAADQKTVIIGCS